mmetsp:Transcript_23771/g.68476  ORF Transcript_23771/g.68476 Transcript_23771/m.68476 type:complete len:111 (-) Transcript_23771:108-440(-)
MDIATQTAMKVELANRDFGGEDTVYCIGSQAYVPRLVQANVPWNRAPMTQMRFGTKKEGRSSLQTLGAEVYRPSGMELRVEDIAGSVATRAKQEPLSSLVKQQKQNQQAK